MCCFTVYYKEHTDHREKKQDQSSQHIQDSPTYPTETKCKCLSKIQIPQEHQVLHTSYQREYRGHIKDKRSLLQIANKENH